MLDFLSIFIISFTPILLAVVASNLAKQVGYFAVCLEGLMLVGAFSAIVFSHYLSNNYLAILFLALIGILQGLFLGLLEIKNRGSSVIVGISYNLIASGLTSFLLYLISGEKGAGLGLEAKKLSSLRLITSYGKLEIDIFFILGLIFFILLLVFLKKTVYGHWFISLGLDEEYAEKSGIEKNKLIVIALSLLGLIASLAGGQLALRGAGYFSRDLIAGRGYIALALDGLSPSPLVSFALALIYSLAYTICNWLSVGRTGQDVFIVIPYFMLMLIILISGFKKKRKRDGKID